MHTDVSDTETGKGTKKSALPHRSANKEVAAQLAGNKRPINKDGGKVGGTDKQKVENQRGGKSAAEGGDVEMHGPWPPSISRATCH